MKTINRRHLRKLIENVIVEAKEANVKDFGTGKGRAVSFDEIKTQPESDNRKAHAFLDPKEIRKKLKIPGSGAYYVYRSGGTESEVKIGNVRYSNGDPYTYEEVSQKDGKRRFRVMSGPSHKDRGTRPIGAIFTPKQEPNAEVAIEGEGRDLTKEYQSLCDSLNIISDVPEDEEGNTVASAKAGLKFFGSFLLDQYLANNQKLPMKDIEVFEQVITAGRNYIGLSGKASRAMGVGLLFAPGIQSKDTVRNNMLEFNKAMEGLADIFETHADDQEAANTILDRLLFSPPKMKDLQGKAQAAKKEDVSNPIGGVNQANLPVRETLSRGSLLRRRYRRY